MTGKKALIFYDDPFIKSNSGTQNRIINILQELKKYNISVDQVIKYREEPNLTNVGSVVDKMIFIKRVKMPFLLKILTLLKLKKATKEEKKFFKEVGIKPYKLDFLRQMLKKKINVNDYDYVLAVNAENAFWIDAFGKKTKKILFMEDVMFNQYKDRHPEQNPNLYMDAYKKYEAGIVEQFDCVFGISQTEINIFKNEKNEDKFIYLPAFMNSKKIEKKDKYDYDIIYVAHDNPHNLKACDWFLKEVQPKILDKKILFVGKICKTIKNQSDYKNITFIDFIENLDDVYNNSKISICPMFSGTGLKIKVVEAFAYGKPVVCNKMGIVGLPDFDTIDNKGIFVSDDADEFISYLDKLLNNETLYNIATGEALKYFNNHFLTDNNVDKIKNIFAN